MERSAVIIGAGLGGLECGHILARSGWKVTVLEQHSRIGGCMQSFSRGGTVFDTGLHFVGGDLEPLAEFGLDRLAWKRLDGEEVVFGNDSFFLPSQGHDAFVEALGTYFPSSRNAIAAYSRTLREISAHPEYMERGAYDFLCSAFDDPMLRNVVSGTALKMDLDPERLPLFVFGNITESFVRGIWRLQGGGSQIAENLASDIRKFGGEVLTGTRTARLEAAGRGGDATIHGGSSTARLGAAVTEDGRRFEADVFISDIHPASLVGMTDGLRKVYAKRISSLENTRGMFTVNIRLSSDAAFHAENRSIYVHASDSDPWHPSDSAVETVGISFGEGTLDLMTPIREYEHSEESRECISRECLDLASKRLPWLKDAIDGIYTSTPDTYRRFTLSPGGSAYGIVKDCRDIMRTSLSVRTPLENLFLTGQNIGIHGVLGVTKSAQRTCNEILKNTNI